MSDLMRSAMHGVVWPAITDDRAAQALALQFQFEQSQWWPPEQLQAQQLKQFESVFRHAVTTVPYYRERFSGFADVSTWDAYRRLPLSSRRDVQDAGSAMHSDAPPAAHGSVRSTGSSGSMGRPLLTRSTGWTQMLWNAFLLRDHLWHRRDLSGKLAAIRSKTGEGRLDQWGDATLPFVTGPSVVRGLSADLDEQLQWLVREDPDYLISFATNIQALARRSRELGLHLPRLREVRTYGEMLRPDARADVREIWGVEIVDSYSSEELGYIALQCPECESYHVQAENLIVEVLDESGEPCRPGETGQIVVSTLHNFAMPLLRYANGDYAEVGAPCRCGRGLPRLSRIVGRQRNMVVRPDGVRHWPSFPSEKWRDVAPIVQIQLVQDAIDHIEARLVLRRALAGDEGARLIAVLQDCLDYPFNITLSQVDDIPRSAGNKYEDFVSLLAG